MAVADTIVAVASPPGGAARGIVRLSGPRAWELASTVAELGERSRVGRRTQLVLPGELRLPSTAYVMTGPASYTGEDVVELHVPGSPPVLRLLVDTLVERGARPAGPGEFTMRAFLNGRMDLTQAEGVQALISARDADEARAARARLDGEAARPLRRIEEALLDLCADVEASLDFAEEHIRIVTETQVDGRRAAIQRDLEAMLSVARAPEETRPVAVLRGRPNVGKSSLFNRLTGGDSIVSDVAGTTRDTLEAEVDGIRLFDTAGDRPVRGVDEADLILHVVDATDPEDPLPTFDRPVVRVVNKIDLRRDAVGGIRVSAQTGEGIDELRAALRERLLDRPLGTGARFQVTVREQASLREALGRLEGAHGGMEVRALELRAALAAIGAVTGRSVGEDLLSRIFSRFCIGK